jgi:hypothetical protein
MGEFGFLGFFVLAKRIPSSKRILYKALQKDRAD